MYLRYLELLLYRTSAELKREASRAYLGFLWWVLEPVMYMGVFYLVFGVGLRKGGPDFVVYLLCGLITWKWLDSTVRTGSGVIASSVGLMNQVYLPKIILPSIIILSNTYKFFIVEALFLIFLIFCGFPANEYWLWLPLIMLVQFILIVGVTWSVAALVPLIPDFKYVINYGMTLIFFMSGIFFNINDLSPEIRDLLMWNPVAALIEAYRSVLLYAEPPKMGKLLYVASISVFLATISAICIARLDRYFPRVVG